MKALPFTPLEKFWAQENLPTTPWYILDDITSGIGQIYHFEENPGEVARCMLLSPSAITPNVDYIAIVYGYNSEIPGYSVTVWVQTTGEEFSTYEKVFGTYDLAKAAAEDLPLKVSHEYLLAENYTYFNSGT